MRQRSLIELQPPLPLSVVLAGLSLLTLAAVATAQTYYGPPVYYSPPVYAPPPVYPPPYEKVYPVQKVVAQEVAVAPLIVTVPVDSKAVDVHAYGSPYYYSSGEAYREKAYLREVLREELRALVSTGGTVQTGVSASVTAPPAAVTAPPAVTAQAASQAAQMLGPDGNAPSSPQQPQQPQQPASQLRWVPDTVTPPDLQQRVLAAFQGSARCASCHGLGGSSKGGFKLVLEDNRGGIALVRQTADKRWKIYGMASTGLMPPAAVQDATKAMPSQSLPDMLRYAAQKWN